MNEEWVDVSLEDRERVLRDMLEREGVSEGSDRVPLLESSVDEAEANQPEPSEGSAGVLPLESSTEAEADQPEPQEDRVAEVEESPEDEEAEVPSQFRWITPGIKLLVNHGEHKIPHAAIVEEDPYLEDDEWLVIVLWTDSKREPYIVECEDCLNLATPHRTKRKREKPNLLVNDPKTVEPTYKRNSLPSEEQKKPAARSVLVKKKRVGSLRRRIFHGRRSGMLPDTQQLQNGLSDDDDYDDDDEGDDESNKQPDTQQLQNGFSDDDDEEEENESNKLPNLLQFQNGFSDDDDESIKQPDAQQLEIHSSDDDDDGESNKQPDAKQLEHDSSDDGDSSEQPKLGTKQLENDSSDDDDDDDDVAENTVVFDVVLFGAGADQSKEAKATTPARGIRTSPRRRVEQTTTSAAKEHAGCTEPRNLSFASAVGPCTTGDYETAKRSLCRMLEMTEEEVVEALAFIGPPYGLNEAMQFIREKRKNGIWKEPKPFDGIKIGMRIRKPFNGQNYFGTVVNEAELLTEIDEDGCKIESLFWKVKFDDGDEDDMCFEEILQYRADRVNVPAAPRGRPLQCLELFCGKGIVTQEFCERKWRIVSVDNDEGSNATIRKNILDVDIDDLDAVPDFVWASPPCQTYSNLTHVHRNAKRGQLDVSQTALEHNFLFQRMTEIMYWARRKHPHLIVVIENPVGSLIKMPLMEEFSEKFGLTSIIVDYCAFGRQDKKPTRLFTNDFVLAATLGQHFRCKESTCRYHGSTHPVSVRGGGHLYNAASIPQPLAEEVAHYVDAKFCLDRIRFSKASSSSNGDE